MNQFHCLFDNFDGLLLFTVVPTSGGHEHANQTLNDRALGFLEAALLVAASSVRDKDLLANGIDLEIVAE